MLAHDIKPVIFYYNPNIFPEREYIIRKDESKRHADLVGVEWVDGDYNHNQWLCDVKGMENLPERGLRCQRCFELRLLAAAQEARRHQLTFFTTTLASSRWKDVEQVSRAGLKAQNNVKGTSFWAQNWRKGGLYERRNQLLREYAFYNQQYCGCEYSMRRLENESYTGL
jgi:predicted adenine nucleotide alpha hydrolase (AANH) superfamily ATPase